MLSQSADSPESPESRFQMINGFKMGPDHRWPLLPRRVVPRGQHRVPGTGLFRPLVAGFENHSGLFWKISWMDGPTTGASVGRIVHLIQAYPATERLPPIPSPRGGAFLRLGGECLKPNSIAATQKLASVSHRTRPTRPSAPDGSAWPNTGYSGRKTSKRNGQNRRKNRPPGGPL